MYELLACCIKCLCTHYYKFTSGSNKRPRSPFMLIANPIFHNSSGSGTIPPVLNSFYKKPVYILTIYPSLAQLQAHTVHLHFILSRLLGNMIFFPRESQNRSCKLTWYSSTQHTYQTKDFMNYSHVFSQSVTDFTCAIPRKPR